MAAVTTVAVQICNEALLFTGTNAIINDFNENTAEAKACKVVYEKTRDALLEKFPWRFCTRRAVLAQLAIETTGWAYTYALPADCLSPRRIWNGLHVCQDADEIPFDVESYSLTLTPFGGLCLLTDKAQAELIYTAANTNPALYSPLFVEALAWAIAVKLCLVLPVKPEWAARCQVMAEKTAREAWASQLRGIREGPVPDSEYTTTR